jgi:protein gp37
MNVTAIEWTHCFGPGTGRTWNPVVGCTFACSYCYARRQVKRQKQNCQQCYDFTPHLHPERLNQPLHRKKPTGIFLGSMCDLYDPNVPQEWRDLIWQVCDLTPQHRYFMLTKQPQNVTDAPRIPRNVMLGVSAEGDKQMVSRFAALIRSTVGEGVSGQGMCISLEPLLEPVGHILGMDKRDWVIVGAQSGRGAFVPPAAWVDHIVVECRVWGIPVFVKDSLRALYRDRDWEQKWPATGPGVAP